MDTNPETIKKMTAKNKGRTISMGMEIRCIRQMRRESRKAAAAIMPLILMFINPYLP